MNDPVISKDLLSQGLLMKFTANNHVNTNLLFLFFRTTGLYTKTLAKVIQQDLTRFMTVFIVVCLPFCGALFLSLRFSQENYQFRYVWV